MDRTSFFTSSAGVFQGGGCRAAAFVGAYSEAVRRGVSFVEVAGTSAGSIIAALVGAGASADDLRIMIHELDFSSFLRSTRSNGSVVGRGLIGRLLGCKYPLFANLLFDQGFYSSFQIFDWMNERLNKLLPNEPHPVTFRSLPIPAHIISTDLVRSEAKIWSQVATPNELVANAVQASCAIPIFFQPVERRYVDGGLLSNLPTFIYSDREHSDRPLSTRVLAFSLDAEEESPPEWNTRNFLKMLINTVVDASQKLQLDQQKNIHVIKIPTGDVKATDFQRMTPQLTKLLMDNGESAARAFFDEELQRVRSYKSSTSMCYGPEELYTHVTDGLDIPLNRVVISENNTDWVYALFPSLLCWTLRDVRIQVLLPEHGDKKNDGVYRRKLLRTMGVEVTELKNTSSVPVRVYILDAKDPGGTKAIVGVDRGSNKTGVEAVIYNGFLDKSAIDSILRQVEEEFRDGLAKNFSASDRTSIVQGGQDQLFELLGTVGQYAKQEVDLAIENVQLDRLVSLTRFVREYKYKQIHHLVKQYSRFSIPLFAAAIVRLQGGKQSILTPPVVEESGGKFILIEGSTRATYCRNLGIYKSLRCVVVRGVRDPLPSEPFPFHQVRVVGRTLETSKRYESFVYDNFRPIENRVHPLTSLD